MVAAAAGAADQLFVLYLRLVLKLAELTKGYSCADVCLVCKEAAMYPVRRLMSELEEFEQTSRRTSATAGPQGGSKRGVFPSSSSGTIPVKKNIDDHAMGPVTQEDALKALETTRPSAMIGTAEGYERWKKDFGSC